MKYLFRIIVFIFLPIAIVLFIASMRIEANKIYLYSELKDGCENRGSFIFRKIYEDSNHVIDKLFLGSSRTINGIDDSLLTMYFKNEYVLNLGLCKFGRNYAPIMLKEVLKTKIVKQLFVEIGYREGPYSHYIVPLVGDFSDVTRTAFSLNANFFNDVYNSFLTRLKILRNDLFQFNFDLGQSPWGNYGFKTNDAIVDSVVLVQKKSKFMEKLKMEKSGIKEKIDFHFAQTNYKLLSEMCKANQIKLTFIYLPEYSALFEKPLNYENCRQYGNILLPPDSVLNHKNYWTDVDHLNNRGARKLTEWLKGNLVKTDE
jgi:hypothetical protein